MLDLAERSSHGQDAALDAAAVASFAALVQQAHAKAHPGDVLSPLHHGLS